MVVVDDSSERRRTSGLNCKGLQQIGKQRDHWMSWEAVLMVRL